MNDAGSVVRSYIPIYHSDNFQSIKRNHELGITIDHDCDAPGRFLLIDWSGECFTCPCDSWLPISVGNIDSFSDLRQVWQNPISQVLQQDISSRKFSWCAVNICGVVHNNIRYPRYQVSINIDESCNLRCPSCRSEKIMLTQGPMFDTKMRRAQHIRDLLERFSEPVHVIMSGNGDVLASNVMRPLIHELDPRPTQTFRIFTNGLLLEKQLHRSRLIPQITEFQISVDAGSQSVYEEVRLGGSYRVLLRNLEYLKELANTTNAHVQLLFVLQAKNWRDMGNFIDLCDQHGFAGSITTLLDWGTWSDFTAHDVIGNANHPEHALALQYLRSLRSRPPVRVTFDANLSSI